MFPGSANGWSRLDGPAGSLVLGAAAPPCGTTSNHLYAVELFARLGLDDGVRAGLLHYNDFDDVERLLAGLQDL